MWVAFTLSLSCLIKYVKEKILNVCHDTAKLIFEDKGMESVLRVKNILLNNYSLIANNFEALPGDWDMNV